MSRLGKMSQWQRSFVIYGLLACSITGLLYLLGHQFQILHMIFGTRSILTAHGITAMLATLAFGSVLPFHLKAGIKSQRKWWSGFSQLVLLVSLLVSGALLYYSPGEIHDEVVSAHWILGLMFFTIFIWHGMVRYRNQT